MQLTIRPWITAGIALTGAGFLAATPVTPPPDVQAPAAPEMRLAAADVETFADQGSISDSLEAAFRAATLLGDLPDDFFNAVTAHTLDSDHSLLLTLLPQLAPDLDPAVQELLDFAASPLSGALIGMVGPFVSPLVAFGNTIEAAFDAQDPWQVLADLPANVFNAFLHGATLNLDALIPLIEESNLIPLPDEVTINGLSIAFGGLFTSGDVFANNASEDALGVGGSLLNSIGMDLNAAGFPLTLTPQPVGPFAGMGVLDSIIAAALDGELPDLTTEGGSDAAAALAGTVGDESSAVTDALIDGLLP